MHGEFSYYSTNSWLSYKINEHYYNGIHYVWCAPDFTCSTNPVSSNPAEIFNTLINDISSNDLHSAKIQQIKLGIRKGADEHFKRKTINDTQRKEIISIVKAANLMDFRPIVYIVNRDCVKHKIQPVALKFKASAFSDEILISDLRSNEFEIIEYNKNIIR